MSTTGAVLRVPLQLYTPNLSDIRLLWNSFRFSTASVGLELAQWQRIVCLSMSFSAGDISPGNLFPARPNVSNVTADCIFCGLSPDFSLKTSQEIIEYYRFTKKDLVETKRLLFTNGAYDPTTSIGPPPFPLSQDLDDTRSLLMYGVGHGEKM